MSRDERPEVLAQFAESARMGERAAVKELIATKPTEPLPTEPNAKQEAATWILAAGATGDGEAATSTGEQLAEWSERSTGGLPTKERRKQILAEHHEKGLPPPEPPPREEQ